MPPQEKEVWELRLPDSSTTEYKKKYGPDGRKWRIVWFNVLFIGYMYLGALYGIYVSLFRAKWQTNLFAFILYITSALGITAGAHRLWTHRSYKARWPLRLMLTVFNTIAFQGSVAMWTRDHQMHHKFTETDADPHNSNRGFFFSHVGWLLVRKHPEITAKGDIVDLKEIYADPILRFQDKHYTVLITLACFVLPTVLPVLWGDSVWNGHFVSCLLRYIAMLNATFLVNSAAHMFGSRPYDKNIKPVETKLVSFLAAGEGFHNYHHTYPWDYKTSEWGDYSLNYTTLFIDLMAKIGWAYDLKTVSKDIIEKRVKRTGDGSHPVWGWDDKDLSSEDKKVTTIIYPEKVKSN